MMAENLAPDHWVRHIGSAEVQGKYQYEASKCKLHLEA
jgi:hypothetical protein